MGLAASRLAPLCVALMIAGGCTTSRCPEVSRSQQQWQVLCARLRCESTSPTAATCDSRHSLPNDEQERALHTVARQAMDSVVRIRTVLKTQPITRANPAGPRETAGESGGTGIVIDRNGLILTNEHVVHGADVITVILPDGSEQSVERIACDPHLDLATLSIRRADLKPVAFSDNPAYGRQPVVAIGRRNATGETRPGLVTRPAASLQNELNPARTVSYDQLIESTADIEPGFSGGPLIDLEGRLVGMNVASAARAASGQPRGYAIPLTGQTREAIARLGAELQRATD
jgi:S1-C subfamily serine protease